MPSFATDLGHGDPGVTYSMLLAADAAGALLGGFVLESSGGLLPTRPTSALVLALLWAGALGAFASVRSYAIALPLLFLAGFFELSFSSMAQTIVQMNAPNEIRGRVLGLYNMSSLGLRAFAGVNRRAGRKPRRDPPLARGVGRCVRGDDREPVCGARVHDGSSATRTCRTRWLAIGATVATERRPSKPRHRTLEAALTTWPSSASRGDA